MCELVKDQYKRCETTKASADRLTDEQYLPNPIQSDSVSGQLIAYRRKLKDIGPDTLKPSAENTAFKYC